LWLSFSQKLFGLNALERKEMVSELGEGAWKRNKRFVNKGE